MMSSVGAEFRARAAPSPVSAGAEFFARPSRAHKGAEHRARPKQRVHREGQSGGGEIDWLDLLRAFLF